MWILYGRWRSRHGLRLGIVSAVAIGAAGCSPDVTRFAENPNGNPYASRPSPGQISAAPVQAAPVARIERQSLPPNQYAVSSLPPPASPAPPPHAAEVTGSVAPAPAAAGWDREGGTPVVVAPGDTIDRMAHRYHVPASAIMQANQITNPSTIQPGQHLVIPRYNVHGDGAKLAHAAAPRNSVAASAMAPAPAPVAAHAPAAAAPAVARPPVVAQQTASASGSGQTLLPAAPIHVVASGDTLSKIAHKYHVKIQELTVANGMQPGTQLKIGMRIAIPVTTPVAKAQSAPVAPGMLGKPLPMAQVKPPAGGGRITTADATVNARVATPSLDPVADAVGASGPASNAAPTFRWPLRGRVTTLFGAKTAAGANDGIDLSVPEGTPVRAADDGVVAYAGNELKGYGNLVLVRHSNGYVTAYANASELMVKRNDQIHRGQVIAKSGQTGTATSPQLHFEIRKNSAPVDPMQYLPADKTASAPL